jgi:hypothetical protein
MRGPEAFDVGALCETRTLENFCSRGAEYLATDDTQSHHLRAARYTTDMP